MPHSNPDFNHRRSIRLPIYDYASIGAYFVTVCAHEKERSFGQIIDQEMHINDLGRTVMYWWNDISKHFSNAWIDDVFIVMPNHIHGIIWIDSYVGAGFPRPSVGMPNGSTGMPDASINTPIGSTDMPIGSADMPIGSADMPEGGETPPLHITGTLGQIVGYFKYQSTKQINILRKMPGVRVWQRNYYERIIRSEEELHAVREYIQNNPLKWEEDEENQKNNL